MSQSDDQDNNRALKDKALKKMQREVDSSDEASSESENENEDSDDGDGKINMKFDEKALQRSKKPDEVKQKGIMGLKFMERAQQKEKEALKSQVNLAAKQIRGEDDYNDSDSSESNDEEDDGKNFIDASSNKFGVKSMKAPKRDDARQTGKEIDADKVLKAARRVTGAAESESESSDSESKP